MDISIMGAVSAVKTAAECVESVKNALSDFKTKETLSKGLDQIIEAKILLIEIAEKYEQLAKVKNDLEQQIARHEQWNATAATYELSEPVRGIFLQTQKGNAASGQSPRYACPKCFGQRQLFILSKSQPDAIYHECPNCHFRVSFQPVTPLPYCELESGIE